MSARLLAVLFAVSLHAQTFPMAKGTYWIYSGTVEWQGGKKELTWKSEILESVTRGDLKVALLRGHPGDLVFYDSETSPQCYALISRQEHEVYLAHLYRSCKLPDGSLTDLMIAENLILKFPMRTGDKFGNDGERDDSMYAWVVLSEATTKLPGVRRIPAGPFHSYTLTYRTNPDHQIVTYVPGIGLTEYSYSHHGTPSEVRMHLTEFHAP